MADYFQMLAKGAEQLLKGGAKSLVKGTGLPGAGLAISIPMAVKKYIDDDDVRLLAKLKEVEGCSHIELIDGGGGPTANLLAWLDSKGGMAFVTGDKNWKTYWHPQQSFRPLSATAVYYHNTKGGAKKAGWQLPPRGGELCGLCERARTLRLKAAAGSK